MTYLFVMDVDYQKLRLPDPTVDFVLDFNGATITLELHPRGMTDDVPLAVLQDAVERLWSEPNDRPDPRK